MKPLALFLLAALLHCPPPVCGQRLTFMTWNVENLFDCRDDSLRRDEAFLPDGEHRWTPHRYWRKLDQLARTIAAVEPQDGWPALVALMEVENDSVLHDLTRHSPLRRAAYAYLVTESPDERGIDVGLLYQPSAFRLVRHRSVRVPSVENGFSPTRDILHAVGILPSGDTLHVLAVHLPSRAGGSARSARHRELASATLRSVADSLGQGKVVVMGDFNTEPSDPLFRQFSPSLVTLMPVRRAELRRPQGTYVFRRQWSFLDHILVSPSLHPHVVSPATVARFPFLQDKDGFPFRTYRGPAYMGGVSDHLPLYVQVEL